MNIDLAPACLSTLALAGLLVVAGVTVRLTLAVWVEVEQTRLTLAAQRLEVDERRLVLDKARLQVTQQVYPDEYGVFPLLWDGSRALDPNRGVVFSIEDGAQVLTPALVQPEQLARILRAGGGWPAAQAAQTLLEPTAQPYPAPSLRLTDLLDGQPSVHHLVLGVTVNNGSQETATPHGRASARGFNVVTGDMADMVHIAVGGSSGWGKSVFLRVLAYQLALSRDPVSLALVDLEGSTFAPFARCDRLLWPVADTETDALAIFRELAGEMERRKGLFAGYPGVDSLAAYNAAADQPETPVVCLIDEATALLGSKDVESALRVLALRARKYALWLVLGGNDWKATSLDTAIRNQLSTRVQFKAMSASQSRVLLDESGAENLDARGRALVRLPGRDLVEIQAPYIDRRDILAAVAGQGPRTMSPLSPGGRGAGGEGGNDTEATRARIRALADQGLTKRQICLELFGYDGGAAYNVVDAVLRGSSTTTSSRTPPPTTARLTRIK